MSDSACGHRVVPVRCKTSGRMMLAAARISQHFACRRTGSGRCPMHAASGAPNAVISMTFIVFLIESVSSPSQLPDQLLIQ
jgi:hypothetical protein